MGILSHLAVLLTAVSPLVACETAATPTPKITSVTFSGSGCPQGNAPKVVGDFNDPTFVFQDFALTTTDVSSSTKNCQAHIKASGAGSGWQVALRRNLVKGHVYLSAGDSLTYYTTVYFSQDASNTESYKGSFENSGSSAINQGVALVNRAGDGNRVWSACTGSSGDIGILNVNFRGVLQGGSKSYFEAFTENWDLDWRRC